MNVYDALMRDGRERRAKLEKPATDIKLPEPVALLKTMYSGSYQMLEVDHMKKLTSVPVFTADQMRAAIAAERAKCGGKNCLGRRWENSTNWVTEDAMKAAIAAERERCIDIVERFDACDPKYIVAVIKARSWGTT